MILSPASPRNLPQNLGLGVFSMRRPGSERSSSSSSSSPDTDTEANSADVASTESDSDSNDDSSSADSSSDSDSSSHESTAPDSSGSASYSADHGSSGALAGTSIHDYLLGVDGHPQRPMRPLPNRARPSIVVLGEIDSTPEKEQSS